MTRWWFLLSMDTLQWQRLVLLFFFFSLLRVCVYRSSQKADDGECDFFHWVTDPSKDKTLEEVDSAVENRHSAVAIWIYKCKDVYTPQRCVAYMGIMLLLLGEVQFGIVVFCSSTAMKQGLLFWEKWKSCAARLQLINVNFFYGTGASSNPWGL